MSSGLQAEAVATIEDRLRAAGVVPVVELPDPDLAVPLAEALLSGGLDVRRDHLPHPGRTRGARSDPRGAPRDPPRRRHGARGGSGRRGDRGRRRLRRRARDERGDRAACHDLGLPMLPGTCHPAATSTAAPRSGLSTAQVLPGASRSGGISYLAALSAALPGRPVRADRLASRQRRFAGYLADPAGRRLRRKLDGEAATCSGPRLGSGHRARSGGSPRSSPAAR